MENKLINMNTYEEHYTECKNLYASDKTTDISNISLEFNCISNMPIKLVESIDNKVVHKFKNNIDVTSTMWSRHISNWDDIPEIEQLCKVTMPIIEEKYFGCHLKVEHLHIYENKNNISLESSWAWHYDDCPKEFVKLAIYLNDVTEDNGCMQVIREENSYPVIESYRTSPKSKKGVPPPVFPNSRIPNNFISTMLKDKTVSVQNLSGPRGTHFLFTPNIIHRGTEPKPNSANRRAIFFFIRPTLNKQSNYSSSAHAEYKKINVKKYELD